MSNTEGKAHRKDWFSEIEEAGTELSAAARYAIFKAATHDEIEAKKPKFDLENPRNKLHGGQRKNWSKNHNQHIPRKK